MFSEIFGFTSLRLKLASVENPQRQSCDDAKNDNPKRDQDFAHLLGLPFRTDNIVSLLAIDRNFRSTRRRYSDTNPLRRRTSFQGASTASTGSSSNSCTPSFTSRTARRSRLAVNQSGGFISKSLGVNSSAVSAAKISAQDWPQTRCANASLSERNSCSIRLASVVVSPQ